MWLWDESEECDVVKTQTRIMYSVGQRQGAERHGSRV